MPRGVARKKTVAAVPLTLEPQVSDVSSDGLAAEVEESVAEQEVEEEQEVESTLPQPDVMPQPAPTQSTAAATAETQTVAMLTQQLQMMQQMMMMQQQQFKTELENTKRFILTAQTSSSTHASDKTATDAEFTGFTTPSPSFRATVPTLPQQERPSHTRSPPEEKQAARTGIENMRLQQRLGLVDDAIVRTSVNPVISPVAEFKLGSTYVTEAGLM